ncbi:transcriptional regulator [Gammaproteobacteria bacterium]|jgi:DNA-binding HxlR family transcriptional regulator|nr:transcriptional regulator [Gammaproteobacteria bacterium]
MQGYGQFCPVAKATEVLGERWTPLIIRELLSGEQSFNALRKGVPLMSPSLLSSRLKSLEATGVIRREKTGRGVTYSLTDSGEELRSIIEQLGVWGQRWARSDMSKKDLDPSLLMWDMHRRIDTSYFGDERTVLRFEFVDYPAKMRLWWLVVTGTEVDICLKDPGHDVDLLIQSTLKTMTQIWMGDLSVTRARREGLLRVTGNSVLNRSMTSWIGCSSLAAVKPARKRSA